MKRSILTPGSWLALALALALVACSGDRGEEPAQPVASPADMPVVTSTSSAFAGLEKHISILASDEFEGREPGTPGEEKTVNYIREQFQAVGLVPGNGDSFFQNVPLAIITAADSASMSVTGDGYSRDLKYSDEMMLWTKRVVEEVTVDASEMVFVGYGVVAPEYEWDDYAGVDVTGKTVVILVNDPGFASGDEAVFKGRTMTYYGRWTYKYEEAAKQGAAAVVIVHEDEAAGYGWGVVANSWSGPQFDLVADDKNMSRVQAEGWVTRPIAGEIFAAAGLDYEEMKQQAGQHGFKARAMGLTLSAHLDNTLSTTGSRNVIGLLPGTKRANEYVFYMAHWDHMGRDTSLEGDQIYNGALDNASGVAGLITLAEELSTSDPRPERSVLFIAVTAEESGLLGSQHYGTHPVVPLRDTIAGINMDGLNIYGRSKDVLVVGHGSSELEDYLADAARGQERYVAPESTPEKGHFYRSDHFNLAKLGVPVLYAGSGVDSVEHGREWGLSQRAKWVEERYHQPSDEYDPAWDLAGAREDLALYLEIGRKIAGESSYPNWYEGTEFRAIRDRSRGE